MNEYDQTFNPNILIGHYDLISWLSDFALYLGTQLVYDQTTASTVRIPHSTNNFQNLLPTVRVTPLNLFSASTVNLHGASNSNMFRNNLQIRLSPLKSPILRKYINPSKRPGMYPSISKCNAKNALRLLSLHL